VNRQPSTPLCSNCGLRHMFFVSCHATEKATREASPEDCDENLPPCPACGLNHAPLQTACEQALCRRHNSVVVWTRDARRADGLRRTWSDCVSGARQAALVRDRLDVALDQIRQRERRYAR
jgi:hypothetical protein